MSDFVDEYLADLRKRLPGALRRDVVDELADHLRESASANGEVQAIRRFGPTHEVARAFAGRAALRDIRRASGLLLLAVITFGLSVFPLPRDLIPAWGATPNDRWPEQAPPVAGLQDAILVLMCVSGTLVLLGVLVSALRWKRIGLIMHAGSFLATVALGTIATVLAVRWERALPVAPGLFWIALYAVVGAAVLGVAGWTQIRAGKGVAAARRSAGGARPGAVQFPG